MNETVFGNNNEKLIVFYTFKDVREFNKFKVATDALINSSVLQKTVFIVFMENEDDKVHLPENQRFNYLSKSDFNFFRQVKNKTLRATIKERFDTLFVFGNMQEKQAKLVNKIKATQRIVANSAENIRFDIRINANATGIEQIATFTKQTLEKIQS